ncbi:myelin-associated glycoprotein-like isoform X2 [Electrophorus electricus]|uniref:myelin-associated glycoprotein-like isoform X2 n=1 Tax=Electrophorus electricus TaxID=8005 RepID=UPI0015CFCB0A|nr:myelin-associated glycoprotein-like isoform X2 [Electrophorus electricus]
MLNNMALAKTLLCLTVITIVHCDFSIKMPSMLEALNGTCIMIPCQFSIPEDQKTKLQLPVTGVWRKASRWFFDSVDIFNSSQKANKLDGKILGDLTQKNCTSVLYNIHSSLSDSYYFRLETGFKYTFETPVWISVKDTLPEPILSRVDISVNEGAEVEIICTAMVPCPQYPPNLTWVPLLGNCTETMEKQADGTFTLSSVLRFVSSHVNHEQRISCTVDYPLQTSGGHNVYESTATITVLFLPKMMIEVNPLGPLRKGENTTLFCSAAANPAVTHIRWFQEREGNVYEVNTTETILTFSMTSDKVGFYFCEAQNAYGKQNSSTVRLEIQEEYDFFQSSTTMWQLLGWGGAALALITILTFTLCIKRRRSRFIQDLNDNHYVYANVGQCNNTKGFSNEAQEERRKMDVALYSNNIALYKI